MINHKTPLIEAGPSGSGSFFSMQELQDSWRVALDQLPSGGRLAHTPTHGWIAKQMSLFSPGGPDREDGAWLRTRHCRNPANGQEVTLHVIRKMPLPWLKNPALACANPGSGVMTITKAGKLTAVSCVGLNGTDMCQYDLTNQYPASDGRVFAYEHVLSGLRRLFGSEPAAPDSRALALRHAARALSTLYGIGPPAFATENLL